MNEQRVGEREQGKPSSYFECIFEPKTTTLILKEAMPIPIMKNLYLIFNSNIKNLEDKRAGSCQGCGKSFIVFFRSRNVCAICNEHFCAS
jgi:hypothetical protein